MNFRTNNVITFLVSGLLCAACTGGKKNEAAITTPSLRDVFKNDFAIGTALNIRQIEQQDSGAGVLVPQQFNRATPENIMKAEIIHPQWNVFNFDYADKMIEYGNKHHISINGHTLIWHSQLPPFVRSIQNADSFRLFFTNHITTIAHRYDGKIFSWDVVNEALDEDGSLRNSIFRQKLGDDYIVEAFRLAGQAAPHTELYYNDYNIEQPRKRAGAVALIKKIQAAGLRIDGVGIQGHWNINSIPFREIEESIAAFSALGIKVMFTELDLSVLPNPWDNNAADVNKKQEYSATMNPYPGGLPDSLQTKLAEGYARLFALFVKYRDAISRVTFWGVNDGQSWLNNWPVPGRTNYPLLFDRNYKPKKAFYEVIRTASDRTGKKAF
ncbi:MAG: endo-1,4-beta-xylanase [Bacteroidota bacterium]